MKDVVPRTERGQKEDVTCPSRSMYLIDPQAKRLFKMLKDDFGFAVVYKKTQTQGDILLKKGRQFENLYSRNKVYSIPCKEFPMRCTYGKPQPLSRRDARNTKIGAGKRRKRRY